MILESEAASFSFGESLAHSLMAGDAIALSGPLGSGKTSIARGILHGLGHMGEVPSPSFPVVLPYEGPELCIPAWHVDLYRLDGPDEVRELGLDSILSDGVLILEWPERMGDKLWPHCLKLTLEIQSDSERCLTVCIPPSWEKRWPFQ